MKLVLEDGTEFQGASFGADRAVRGEVVFNTGLTGYVETLTDPSYCGQILVLTYPLQGNYGVPSGPFESPAIQPLALVVATHTTQPSHRSLVCSLDGWLKEHRVVGMHGVDTRALTLHLRKRGTMLGQLGSGDFATVDMDRVVDHVSVGEITRHDAGDKRVLVIDTGAKESIITSLLTRGVSVIRAPYRTRWHETLAAVDAVVLTNGPGDPSMLSQLIDDVRTRIVASGIPVFGICLGHQLLALACGAKTYKMSYGHRSQNQPVLDRLTGRAYITSQNHGYAVDGGSLPRDLFPWFVNLNDETNEGLRHQFRPIWSVQFHPEASAGPRDTTHLFDDFLHMAFAVGKRR